MFRKFGNMGLNLGRAWLQKAQMSEIVSLTNFTQDLDNKYALFKMGLVILGLP